MHKNTTDLFIRLVIATLDLVTKQFIVPSLFGKNPIKAALQSELLLYTTKLQRIYQDRYQTRLFLNHIYR